MQAICLTMQRLAIGKGRISDLICKNCGAENPDYYVFCQNCFADLSKQKADSGQSYGSDGANGYDTPSYVENDTFNDTDGYSQSVPQSYSEEPNAPQQRPAPTGSQAPYSNGRNSDQIADSVAQGVPPREARQGRKQVNRDARELEKLQSNQSAEYYDYYDYYDEAALKQEKTRSRKGGLVIAIVVVALLAVAAVAGILYANSTYGSVGEAFSAIFSGQQGVTVEATTQNDKPAHRLTIRGKVGETLRFTNLSQPDEVVLTTNEAVGYVIDDEQWIPVDPDPTIAEIEVAPVVILVDKNGNETQLTVEPYMVQVPQVELTITSPAVLEGNVTDESPLPIIGSAISANGNAVTLEVNGVDYTSQALQPDGTISFRAELSSSEYKIELVAKAIRSRMASVTLTGTSTASLMPFKVDGDDVGESIIRTSESMLTVTGQGPIGQTGDTMTVTGGSTGDITYDPATGRFSFVVRLIQGQAKTTLTLTAGQAAPQELTVYLVPDVNEYANQAIALNYDTVKNASSEAFNKIYYFTGTIVSISEDNPNSFVVNVDGDAAKPIQVNYYGLVTPEVGTEYLFYATSTGTTVDKTMLSMECYFMYSRLTLDSLSAQSGTATAATESTEASAE